MSQNDRLLRGIQGRQQKQTEFGYGIITADRYVRTMQECVGLDTCYHLMSHGKTSFDDVLQKASGTLVYSNSEMEVEEVKKRRGLKVDIPKNTLMVFRHTLTTSKKDRDGDILRTDGATVDPKMLLLWQHVHTMPIGKMLGEDTRTKSKLVLISAIVDMNELSHDAAVMVDNDMARFSHGFRALEFVEMKAGDGDVPGFDVKRFEIMEESMVSVPANIDANTEEVLLSLVEGGKLTSALMKATGKGIRERMPLTISATAIGEIDYEDEPRDGKSETGESGQVESLSTSEKTEKLSGENKAGGTENAEVKEGKLEIEFETYLQYKEDNAIDPSENMKRYKEFCQAVQGKIKAGRSLSKANEAKLRDAKESVDAVIGMDIPRPAKAALREASSSLKDVLGAFGDEDDGKEVAKEVSVKEAMSIVLAKASPEQIQTMLNTLQAFQGTDESHRRGDEFSALGSTG